MAKDSKITEEKTNSHKKQPTKVNYFIGNDKTKWRNEISTYKGISFSEIYPNIKLNLQIKGNNVEKVFTVYPGGSVKDIQVKIEGANLIKINAQGQLHVDTGLGPVKFTKPVAFQEKNGRKVAVSVKYFLTSQNTYGFEVGDYDESLPLVIDPLIASTFAGQSYDDAILTSYIDDQGTHSQYNWA